MNRFARTAIVSTTVILTCIKVYKKKGPLCFFLWGLCFLLVYMFQSAYCIFYVLSRFSSHSTLVVGVVCSILQVLKIPAHFLSSSSFLPPHFALASTQQQTFRRSPWQRGASNQNVPRPVNHRNTLGEQTMMRFRIRAGRRVK